MTSFVLSRKQALRGAAAGIATLALTPFALAPAAAAFDTFMQFDDPALKGTGPGNSIEITSFSFGASQQPSAAALGSGAGTGKARFSDFTITKTVDAASPKLLEYCANGKHFPKMTFSVSGKTYTFSDLVILTDVKTPGTPPTEKLTFSYAAVTDDSAPKPEFLHPLAAPTKKPG
jgi:type VI protein secretion system component Hcp